MKRVKYYKVFLTGIIIPMLLLAECITAIFSHSFYAGAATTKSDGKNMIKVLKYYGQKKYSLAQKYSKKLSATAKEPCVSKMSSKMKKAYYKVVKQYSTDNSSGKAYIWGYYLTDIDNDKKTDLIVKVGSCEGDCRFYVYQYKKGKAGKIGSVAAVHAEVYAYPNHNGVVIYGGVTQSEWISMLTIKKKKLKVKSIGSRQDVYPYFNLRCQLNSHVSRLSSINCSDLK